MSTVDVKVISDGGIPLAPAKFEAAANRALGKVLEQARIVAKNAAPGSLGGKHGGYGAVRVRIEHEGKVLIGIISATARNAEGLNFAYFVHEGTGLYGPGEKRYILPKRKKVMVFLKEQYRHLPRPTTPEGWKEYRLKGYVVYARFTRGQHPQKFLEEGLKEARRIARDVFNAEIPEITGVTL